MRNPMFKLFCVASVATLLIASLLLGAPLFRDHDVSSISWNSGEITLQGSLYLPKTAGPHPCIVIVHGSGNLSRFGRSGKIFRDHGEELARRGIAVAIYDKRGCGRSGGDWKTANLNELANDVSGLLDLLKKRPEIDGSRIGLLGCSQGSWVSIIAASNWPKKVNFLITLSGSANTPAEQGHFILEEKLRTKGFKKEQIEDALKLDRLVTEVYRTNDGWDEARAAIQKASSEDWFKDSMVGLQKQQSWNWKWYRDLPFDLDPKPMLSKLQIPVLAMYGADDPIVSTKAGVEMIKEFSDVGRAFESIVYPDCAHLLRHKENRNWTAPEKYWNDLLVWLRRNGIQAAENDTKKSDVKTISAGSLQSEDAGSVD